MISVGYAINIQLIQNMSNLDLTAGKNRGPVTTRSVLNRVKITGKPIRREVGSRKIHIQERSRKSIKDRRGHRLNKDVRTWNTRIKLYSNGHGAGIVYVTD